MDGRADVLSGSVGRTLFLLAWPVIAAEGIHTAFHLVDIAWVGPLGAWATGAIMTSMFTLWMAFSLANLVVTGLQAQVSRAVGAGDRARAGHAVAQGLYLCVALGLVVAVVGWACARGLFTLLGTDPRTAEAGGAYLRIMAVGSPAVFLYHTAGSVMRACGNTRTPMKVTAWALLANAILSPFLIFGWGPFPELGVPGSGIATVICMAGAFVAYVWLALGRHPDLPLETASLRRIDLAMMAALARVGAPYAAIGVLFSVVYLYYAHLASAFGAAPLAVLGIGNRLESITYLTAEGFAVATATFVGQNLGAGAAARAERGAWRAIGYMGIVGVGLSILFIALPGPLLGLFTRDAEAIRIGIPYLRVLGLCQFFTAIEGVVGGGFAGSGDTVPPMAVHVSFALVRLPLAWWAVRVLGMGLMGIAWTMSLTCIIRGAILAGWFRRGTWKSRRLPGTASTLPAAEAPDLLEIGPAESADRQRGLSGSGAHR